MLKGLTFLPSLVLAASLAMPIASAAAPHSETVVARVNGEEITLGHVIIARQTLPQQYQQLPNDVLYDAIVKQLVQQTALKQSLQGPTPQLVELSLENERRSLLAGEAIDRVMQDAATEDDVRTAYETRYADGFGGTEYNASHILVESKEDALDIKDQLDSGADFAEMAKEKSTGPSGPNGGSLGWFGEGRMVPEFEEAVKSLEPGQISDPVATQFGWHLIQLSDKRQQSAPELDAVRGELEAELREEAVGKRVVELVEAAEVEYPEIEDLSFDMIQDLDLVRN
ncbi:peptidylprolyl isomerase [Aliisedimentitalea scapharcae]|uniref:Parvulin-like PPIase n=1 Tax=Aliisedimentitalea scapharcae TaxID=1524259 RepID=A0ABZ2XTT1_9RHOB|nr:peptidylprolyl isomerase [Rhodobacteraceae bacterium M382]